MGETKHFPFKGLKFKVLCDGVQGAFKTVRGLAVEHDTVEYREGDEVPANRKSPGLTKVDTVTLSRGIILKDTDLWDWVKQAGTGVLGETPVHTEDGEAAYKRALTIQLCNRAGVPKCQWTLWNCWAKRLSVGDLGDAEVVIQELVVEAEGLKFEYL